MSIPREKIFGFILFSGFVVLTCNASWMRRTPLLRILRTPQLTNRAAVETDPSFGNLITTQSESFRNNKWRNHVSRISEPDTECELEIVNDLDEQIILCWVDETGKLYNYYPVNDRSIKDNSVSNVHVEYTHRGHCFVGMKKCNDAPKSLKEVPDDKFLFIYVPEKSQSVHKVTLNNNKESTAENSQRFSFFRSKKSRVHPTFHIRSECIPKHPDDDALIDTTNKFYEDTCIHGFRIKYEPKLFEESPAFHQCLQEDLGMVVKLLPPNACRLLQQDTIFWINKSIIYGKKSKPIVGRACTFHPRGGAAWLENNGLSTAKEGCIEFMCIDDYLHSRTHWGTGGVLLHELSHAFHNKCCENGFENALVREVYESAMEKKLYHSVKVHGPQGVNGPQKAYACTNCMEYFAELSVAYHWKENDTCEYNKWFPFNRKQLREYDSASFEILKRCWEQYE
jgi:hypothetical protein